MNPETLELPSGRDLSRDPETFAEFKAQRDTIDALRGAGCADLAPAGLRAGQPARASARLP